MKIDTEIRDDHQAKLTVEIEGERLEEMKRRAAAKIGRKVKLPGFRPGKAPYAVILRQVGEGAVLEEALEMLVDEIYPEVIKTAEIEAYGPGSLEGVPSMDPPTLEFVVPLAPQITLGDYRAIQKEYSLEPVTPEDVDLVLKDLRERQAVLEPVERPAQAGDLVTVLLRASYTRPEEDEQTPLIRERSYPVIVLQAEESDPNEWPFPSFSQNLVGLSAGDERSLTYTYSEESTFETLRGREAEFHFAVENVKERTLPDLDDELAKTVGDYEDLEALRRNIAESLETERREQYNEQYDEDILEQAVETTTYRYPPQMIEREIDSVIDNLSHRLEHQKSTLDLYLKARNLDMEGLRKELLPVAESRLKRTMFLVELGKAENVQLQPAEVEKATLQTLGYLSQSLGEKDARKLYDRQVQSNIMGSVIADMMAQRSLARFRSLTSGIPEPVAADAAEQIDAVEEEPAEEPAAELADETAMQPAAAERPSAGQTDAVESPAAQEAVVPVEEEAEGPSSAA